MKLSELKEHSDIVRDRRAADPEYALEADRLALAGEVGAAVVSYRRHRELTQTEFGRLLGWKQPQVARLEAGDVTPSTDSLQRLARAGVIEVHFEQEGTLVRELASA